MAKSRRKQSKNSSAAPAPETTTVSLPMLLRVVGRDRPAQQVLRTAATSTVNEFVAIRSAAMTNGATAIPANESDYAQIDQALTVQPTPILSEPPRPGSGYSGFTPAQRHHFLQWINHTQTTAPLAFRQLYIAQLEVNLFDEPARAVAAQQELFHLADAPAWQGEESMWRALLLSFWLRQDGAALGAWLTTKPTLPPALVGLALGLLAQPTLAASLTPEHLLFLAERWSLPALPALPVLRLRLAYLESTFEQPLLPHALGQLAPDMLVVRPWRCVHRHLRIALPQPDLRVPLESIVRELALGDGESAEIALPKRPAQALAEAEEADATADVASSKWQLTLEFGDSRSEYFGYVVQQVERLDGYRQILDENRRMIHRTNFAKRDLRRFWRIWEYVQNWSTTQVFVNGKLLNKWEVYPYSPYLR